MQRHAILFALMLPVGCNEVGSEPSPVSEVEEASQGRHGHGQGHEVDHTCTLATLPSTCGVAPADLPCCAVDTEAGEEQMDCCPSSKIFIHRICADGAPSCPAGGTYPTCAGVVCPPLSAPCTDGPGCCNECGQIGPRGCSVCDSATYDTVCNTRGLRHRDVCIGTFDVGGEIDREITRGDDHHHHRGHSHHGGHGHGD